MSDAKSTEVTFKYYLPEHNNELWLTTNASALYSALWEINDRCRGLLKYDDPETTAGSLARFIQDCISEYVDLDECP